jgi:hypothetical protein
VLSSDRDDSFIKLHEASSVLFAARVRIVHMLVFINCSGNYDGFDLLLKYFSLSRYMCVAFSSFCCCTCVVFLTACFLR